MLTFSLASRHQDSNAIATEVAFDAASSVFSFTTDDKNKVSAMRPRHWFYFIWPRFQEFTDYTYLT